MLKKRGPKPKEKIEPEKETAPSIPFKKGQVFSDMKIVAIVPESIKPVHYVLALRGRRVEKGVVVSGEGPTAPILKDEFTGKVMWGEDVHMMSVEDFKVCVDGKIKVQPNVE